MIDDKALLSEYLSESEELLDSLLADLDALTSSTGTPDTNRINRAFRAVHSLKGLSGMMGLAEVQSLAHEFEDILDDLRLGLQFEIFNFHFAIYNSLILASTALTIARSSRAAV